MSSLTWSLRTKFYFSHVLSADEMALMESFTDDELNFSWEG